MDVRAGAVATWLLASGCGRVGFDARGGDGGGGGDGGATGDSSSDAVQATGCTGTPVARSWPYTSSAEGWQFKTNSGYTATMSWTSSVGMPDSGALVIDVTSGSGVPRPMGWFYFDGLGDLSGRVASAFVRTDAANVVIKVYGRNDSSDWMDGGAVTLIPDEWRCVTLDTTNPNFMDPTFDPTMFDETGLLIDAAAPATIWVDHWGV